MNSKFTFVFACFMVVSTAFFHQGCSNKAPQTPQKTAYKKQSNKGDIELESFINTRSKDCSALISAINAKNNQIYFNPTTLNKYFTSKRKSQAIYNLFQAQNRLKSNSPQKGDLVFFSNTTKETKFKKTHEITHIGVVLQIIDSQNLIFLHNSGGKNILGYLNLSRKNDHIKDGKIINSYLISKCKSAYCLASNRFSAFGVK
nr:C40 family peptidase [Campylobacter sp.]